MWDLQGLKSILLQPYIYSAWEYTWKPFQGGTLCSDAY